MLQMRLSNCHKKSKKLLGGLDPVLSIDLYERRIYGRQIIRAGRTLFLSHIKEIFLVRGIDSGE